MRNAIVARDSTGVAPATASSADRTGPAPAPGSRLAVRAIGTAAATPGTSGIAPTSRKRAQSAVKLDASSPRRIKPMTTAPVAVAAVMMRTARRTSTSWMRSASAFASGIMPSGRSTPATATAGPNQVARSGQARNGVAVATASGTASGRTDAPARPLARSQTPPARIRHPTMSTKKSRDGSP